jgi:tRNA pseudouridine55 synthase
MDGVFVVNKGLGETSFDVVKRIRRAAKTKKVGHAGTLDPDASGVLVIAAGNATRLLRYISGAEKRYEFTMCLGASTTTDDHSGEVLEECAFSHVEREALEHVLSTLTGTILQVPPRFSAIHVDGERAYDLARKNIEFELPAREAQIFEWKILRFDPPMIDLEVHCGSGTYVRSLARDIGRALGSCAHTTRIHRTQVGAFTLNESQTIEAYEANPELCVSMLEMLRGFSKRVLTPEEEAEIRLGRRIPRQDELGLVALVSHDGRLVGVGDVVEEQIQPQRVLNS